MNIGFFNFNDTEMTDKEKARRMGKGFAYEIDIDIITKDDGKYKGEITMDNQDFYYETDPYKDKECAIAELKGWWNGTKIKVEQYLKSVENENAL